MSVSAYFSLKVSLVKGKVAACSFKGILFDMLPSYVKCVPIFPQKRSQRMNVLGSPSPMHPSSLSTGILTSNQEQMQHNHLVQTMAGLQP